jgi:hypothetical protein
VCLVSDPALSKTVATVRFLCLVFIFGVVGEGEKEEREREREKSKIEGVREEVTKRAVEITQFF